MCSSKLGDDLAEEQLTESASLRTILQWYERYIYRNLYLPLFQSEVDTTIKCVRIPSACRQTYPCSDHSSMFSLMRMHS